MNLWSRSSGFFFGGAAGLFAPSFFSYMPPMWALIATSLPGLIVAIRYKIYWPIACCAGVMWSSSVTQSALHDRFQMPANETHIIGLVKDLPVPSGDGIQFEMDLEFVSHPEPVAKTRPGKSVLVRWYDGSLAVRPGQRWSFNGRITTTQSRLNFNGFDQERHYWVRGIDGVFTVSGKADLLSQESTVPIQAWRYNIREELLGQLRGYQRSGLIVALAIGDRSRLQSDIRDAMTATGTSHLLAISGLHVGFVGWLTFRLSKMTVGLLVRRVRWPARQIAMIVGATGALVYALVAGFGASPQRAFVMFAVVASMILLRRQSGPWQGWLMALMLILLISPQSAASPGLWLSFGAVAALFIAFVGYRPVYFGARALIRAQVAVSLILLPLTLLTFQTGSPAGFLANILAIPFVSLIALPLVLFSLISAFSHGAFSQIALAMADGALVWLSEGLIWLAANSEMLRIVPSRFSIGVAIPATLGALMILSPRALRLKACGALLMLPMLAPATAPPRTGEWTLDVLDVGQGSASLVQTHGTLTLIDTGPGIPGSWDLSQSVLLPAIKAYPRQSLRMVVVTHGDLDHAGGLERIHRAWPHVAYLGNTRTHDPRLVACTDVRNWSYDGVDFDVLHPSPFLPYQGNNSSCVLNISGNRHRALLTGDIETSVERRLTRQYQGDYSLILAPHHGSKSSSSPDFARWSMPEWVAVSAGSNNRFGFPHPTTVQRYQAVASVLASTSDCGGLRFKHTNNGQLAAQSARRHRPALWRWPPTANCP